MGFDGDCNLLVAGVGGQGSVLIGNILGEAAISEGLHVWVGETFGMSQRGGSVVSHIRIGRDILSPITPEGEGDVVLGLEPMEALRVAHRYLRMGGKIILNPRQVLPSDVISGLSGYPSIEDIFAALDQLAGEVHRVDAAGLAEKSGNTMTVNTVMLGALAASRLLPLSLSSVEAAIRQGVPPKTVDVNLKAFSLGVNAVQTSQDS